MTRTAVVAEMNDSWIVLLSFDEVENAQPQKCYTSASKGDGHCGCRVGGRPFRADIPKNLNIRVGDKVEVSASTANAFGALFVIIGIPVLAGFLSRKLIGTFFSDIGEPARALAAALGLALGIGITILAAGRKKRRPKITRILE